MTKKKALHEKPVAVHWIDSAIHSQGWKEKQEFIDVSRTVSVVTFGFIVRQDRHSVTVAQSVITSEDEDCEGGMTIPRGCIRKIRKLK